MFGFGIEFGSGGWHLHTVLWTTPATEKGEEEEERKTGIEGVEFPKAHNSAMLMQLRKLENGV